MGTIIPYYTQESNILDYLLCVNGNGYSWIDGQLGEYVFNEEMDEKEKPLQEDYIPQRLTEKAIFPSGITLYQTTGGIFYPICQYAKIYVVPDNIKADWLETCKTLLNIIELSRLSNSNIIRDKRRIQRYR